MKKALFLIIPDGFRDEEYQIPKDYLEQKDVLIETASSKTGLLAGKMGQITANVNLLIQDINPDNYDLLAIIGGGRTFWNDKNVIELIKQMHSQDKIIGAICSSAVLPAQAGLLTNKPGTAFGGEPEIKELEKYQVIYQANPLEVAEKIVTADGPDSALLFAKKLWELLNSNL